VPFLTSERGVFVSTDALVTAALSLLVLLLTAFRKHLTGPRIFGLIATVCVPVVMIVQGMSFFSSAQRQRMG
jgi:hypothetical protein